MKISDHATGITMQSVTPADAKDRVKAYLSQDGVGQWLRTNL
jgi:hypothetical protein